MDFNNSQSPVTKRIIFLALSIIGFSYFAFTKHQYFLAAILLVVSIVQINELLKYLDRNKQSFRELINSITFDDFTSRFKSESSDPKIKQLQKELNDVLTKLQDTQREKESEFLFFRNIVMHIGIGLIVFKEDGKVEICNSAARKLLKLHDIENIALIQSFSNPLYQSFKKLKTGGRELIQLNLQDELIQLSVYAIELTLRNENVKLVSLQNIQNELEEKEMEAWQNLVRVLTHEIMNSVTPISSLAGVVEQELRPHIHRDTITLTSDDIQDIHLSLQTIGKRSEGLIHFVKEFRSLTNIPKPRPKTITVQELFGEIGILCKAELAENQIQLETSVYPEDLTLLADKTMIEQILINLIKNSIQSFEDRDNRGITLRAYLSEKSKPILSVKDNGAGIDPEALDKIFIPFFTTKKKGSGIGLSLSRQIMRQHQGSLTVKSEVGTGTEFFLKF